jgi:hypothetical protein
MEWKMIIGTDGQLPAAEEGEVGLRSDIRIAIRVLDDASGMQRHHRHVTAEPPTR